MGTLRNTQQFSLQDCLIVFDVSLQSNNNIIRSRTIVVVLCVPKQATLNWFEVEKKWHTATSFMVTRDQKVLWIGSFRFHFTPPQR